MLTQQTGTVNPLVQRVLEQVTLENSRFDRDLRSVKREKIVLPVTVLHQEESGKSVEINCFTRDLSVAGACLVAPHEFTEHETTTLSIYRLNGQSANVFAECRWCKPFGTKFWVSGWQFLRLNQSQIAEPSLEEPLDSEIDSRADWKDSLSRLREASQSQ